MHPIAQPKSALVVLLAFTGFLGCTTDIPDDDLAVGGSGFTAGSAGQPAAAGSSGSSGGANCEAMPPRAPLRRLTRFEYNNTVRELLGDESSPGNALPPEELGNGFGNDADSQPVGDLLALQLESVAQVAAANATKPERIAELSACAGEITSDTPSATELRCVRSIVDSLGPKAFRRPLLAGEADSLLELFQEVRSGNDFATSLAGLLEGVLQSPEFIYKPELGEPVAGRTDVLRPTGDEMATRLSYLFWASPPDELLRAAAASGELHTPEGVAQQAQRLLADQRSRPVVRFFFDNLLPISGLTSLERDEYPSYTPLIGSLLHEETQTFLEYQIFSGAGTWPSVFTADYTFLNQELAGFYGVAGVSGDGFQKVALDTTQRAGLLGQAGIVAGPVHSNHENPVVRGAFVVQKLLCLPIPKPSGEIAAKVTPPDPESAATARQRFTQHSLDDECRGCHVNMDPIGYALENYDVIGQWRDQENGVTIDASADSPALGKFNGPVELGQRLAESEQVQVCFAKQWMNFGYGRTLKENEACIARDVQAKFKAANYNVQELLVALTQSDAFTYLPAERE